MERIQPESAAWEQAGKVFSDFGEHLAVAAVLAGAVPGAVWVDRASRPRFGLLSVRQRLYLAGGQEGREEFAHTAHSQLEQEILPALRGRGIHDMVLHAGPSWAEILGAVILRGRFHRISPRSSFRLRLDGSQRPATVLPAGYTLRPVDADLLADGGLGGLDELREEMCSERPTVEDFLQHSFGTVPLYGGSVVGWCLSEYNLGDRCEVGIATAEAHRRRGLAAATGAAMLAQAAERGIRTVGWHCWTGNLGSRATAARLGFELAHEEIGVYIDGR